MHSRLLAIIVAISAIAAPAFAQAAPPVADAEGSTFLLNARNVDIQVFADDVSSVTGRTLILDPSVNGKVTVISQEPLDADGVWALFQSVLRVQGYAAIQSGQAWRVISQADARQSGPVSSARAKGAELITRLIKLETLGSTEAAAALKPLLSSTGSVEAFNRPNALIVTGFAEDIARIEALAKQLDSGGAETFATIPLVHATAVDTVALIEKLMGDGARGPRIVADVRSNQLLVRGTDREVVEARRLTGQLDQPGGAIISTRVFKLSHSDAEAVIDVLRGVTGVSVSATNPISRRLLASERSGAPVNGVQNLTSNPAVANRDSQSVFVPNGGTGQDSPGELALHAAPDINAIVARGSATQLADLEALIEEMDVRRPQVMIEAAIVEINGDAAEQFGVQFGIGDAAPPGSAGAVSFSDQGLSLRRILAILGVPAAIGITDDGLSAGIGSGGDFGLLVQAFGSSTKANLLSTPSITTLDNQPAEIVVGQNVPFRTGSFSTTGNTTTPFTTIEREDVGITLRVFPRIYEGDIVRLDVSQEVSSLINSVIPGASDLVTNRRSIQTTVLADNGGTVVLGGLITDDRISGESKVPVLGDVPLVGNLFKSKTESGTRRTLFVFLRPTILRSRKDIDDIAVRRMDDITVAEAELQNRKSVLLNRNERPLTIGEDVIY